MYPVVCVDVLSCIHWLILKDLPDSPVFLHPISLRCEAGLLARINFLGLLARINFLGHFLQAKVYIFGLRTFWTYMCTFGTQQQAFEFWIWSSGPTGPYKTNREIQKKQKLNKKTFLKTSYYKMKKNINLGNILILRYVCVWYHAIITCTYHSKHIICHISFVYYVLSYCNPLMSASLEIVKEAELTSCMMQTHS